MPPKQKDKEVIFFLTNVGVQPEDGDNDYLEKAKEVMTHVITKKIFFRPKDEVGIMLGGCADIDGAGEEDRGKLFQVNEVPSWEMVEKVTNLRQTDVHFYDWHVALSNTLDVIQDIEASRVVLIMLFDCDDACNASTSVYTQELAERLTHLQIQLLWMGSKPLNNVPFERLHDSERLLMTVVEPMGEYRQIDIVLPQLRFYKKPKSNYMAWKCLLELGNITIATQTFVKATDEVKKPPFKNVTARNEPENDDDTSARRDNPDDFNYVRNERDYVDRRKETQPLWDTINGYMYGRQFVPVPEADEEGMKYNGGPKSFKIFGFVPRESIQLEDLTGETTRIVLPQDPLSAKPFYCLAQAMAEANRAAIVRRIYAATHDPKMGVLIPRLDAPGEPWGMILIELLFAEDRRVIQSRPLNSIMNNLSKEKEDIVEEMIDAMMLTECSDDEACELFAPGTVPSPNLQHLWNSLSFRALHPDDPSPPMSKHLWKLIEPPESIKIKQEPLLKKLRELFPIEDELALLKKASETSDKVAVPVLSEVTNMESDLTEMASGINEVEKDAVGTGCKRKRSMEEVALPLEESNVDPDLEDLFDADMSP